MISVIIPTYNESSHILLTIRKIRQYDQAGLVKQIIVADGGSTDNTAEMAALEGAEVFISPKKGRAAQMNYGASFVTQTIMYFLHADTIPVNGFTSDVVAAIEGGAIAGCFMLSFNYKHWFLQANCWFTRFDVAAFRYGDQSLFVNTTQFSAIQGFNETLIVFEDYDIIKRLKKMGSFTIIKKPVITSARKYTDNGIFKIQGIFYLMYFLYRFGFPQEKLVSTYKRLVKQDKL
ncbi:MAG: TIGR04283 family arsenosugar biosynthesis glycosyltransferase [Chitinophagaceae bacterium]